MYSAARGRRAITRRLALRLGRARGRSHRARDLRVHETADPEVVVAEFVLLGEVPATGATYRLSYVQVIRVRDGRIVSFRDYLDPRIFATLPSAGSTATAPGSTG